MKQTETDLVKHFTAKGKLSKAKFPIGIGDDMAMARLTKGSAVLITTDMLLDGAHFDSKKQPLEKIGYKSMAVSLSDCAAMATIPIAAVVAVALPRKFGAAKLKKLHAGILKASKKYNCPLIGGDMTSWAESLAVTVTMISKPAKTKPVKRSGAKVGDIICVTGPLGGSIVKKHLTFKPRIEEALAIAKAGVNSMIDITDGLSSDLNHICRMSKKGAIVEAVKIPISADAKKTADPLNSALNDGEDFELLFTISPKNLKKLKVKAYQIGKITKGNSVQIKSADGKLTLLKPSGYDHLTQAHACTR